MARLERQGARASYRLHPPPPLSTAAGVQTLHSFPAWLENPNAVSPPVHREALQGLWGPGERTTGVDRPSTLRAGMWIWLLPLEGNWKESLAGERGAMGLSVLQKWMVEGRGLGVSSTGVRAWEVMTVGVRVLVDAPGASRLLTAALTLSRERPGGRDGEEGSSRPRGFFGLGGAASVTDTAAADGVLAVEVVTGGGGATGSVGVSLHSPALAGC